ncbi:MAG: hypothetical protein U0931_12375 [Vulcanimicrobiota bacterium]
MTEPTFEKRFLELLEEKPVDRYAHRPAVVFLQALFEEAGNFEEEDAAA